MSKLDKHGYVVDVIFICLSLKFSQSKNWIVDLPYVEIFLYVFSLNFQ